MPLYYHACVRTLSSQVESNTDAFNRVPDSFLDRLTELLSTPMLGSDVLAPKAGALSAEWLDTNCRVLPPSIAGVDGEVGFLPTTPRRSLSSYCLFRECFHLALRLAIRCLRVFPAASTCSITTTAHASPMCGTCCFCAVSSSLTTSSFLLACVIASSSVPSPFRRSISHNTLAQQVRDTTLEVMCFLARLSDTLRSRLGAASGCIRALTRLAIATTAGERVDHQVCGCRRLPSSCRWCCNVFYYYYQEHVSG